MQIKPDFMPFSIFPDDFNQILGQENLLGENAPLRLLIENGKINFIVFGPTGSGKTTLCRLISKKLNIPLLEFNATNFKTDNVRKELVKFDNSLLKPLVFIDEIHRLNTAQQDFLLPLIESRAIFFIGASSENPFHTLNNALRSRVNLFEFKSLSIQNFRTLFKKCLEKYPFKNIKNLDLIFECLVENSNGDCRVFLNLFENISIFESHLSGENIENIALEMLLNITKNTQGSKQKDVHFDLISALIKSIRGSDPDAALFYLSRLINGGEVPEFIARRLVILASEDIGNANPNALNLSVSTMHAVCKIGYPEARIILSQCVIYLSCSPKSNNAYKAINKALNHSTNYPVPNHLKTHSKDYLYPHDFNGFVKQEYFPQELVRLSSVSGEIGDSIKYVDFCSGFENTLKEWLNKIKSGS